MALPPLGNVNGPFQQDIAAVPRVNHDIRGGGQAIRTLQHRDRAIAIFHVNGVHIMPYLNAATRMSSGHIVRIFDSRPPPHLDFHCTVDLYILDENLYIAVFRRRRISVEQLQAGVDDSVGWSRWFVFRNMVLLTNFYFKFCCIT